MKIAKKSKGTTRHNFKIIGIGCGVLLILAAGLLWADPFGWRQAPHSTPSPAITKPTVVPAEKPLKEVSEQPARLRIAKLGVDAQIDPLGLDKTGAMAAPAGLDTVGWYNKSALAGGSQYAVLLDGHYGEAWKPGVFFRLNELALGDTMELEGTQGARLTYRVVEKENTRLEDVDMKKAMMPYAPGKQSLTIITCEGEFDASRKTYDSRVVIYAERIS